MNLPEVLHARNKHRVDFSSIRCLV